MRNELQQKIYCDEYFCATFFVEFKTLGNGGYDDGNANKRDDKIHVFEEVHALTGDVFGVDIDFAWVEFWVIFGGIVSQNMLHSFHISHGVVVRE